MGLRKYNKKNSVVFRKTTEEFGGLSNMASGFNLYVNEVIIPSSEHLYQAMRFPTNPEIQFEIINQDNAMLAKKVSNKYKEVYSRPDWNVIQVRVMRWVLEIKLAQNWEKFSSILRATGNRSIVEYATDDKVWGAKPFNSEELVGTNALGRLLMELREKYVYSDNRLFCISTPSIPAFLLYNQNIELTCDDNILDYQDEELLGDLCV